MRRLIIMVSLSLAILPCLAQYKYLGKYTADGTPLYFVTRDIIPTSTLDKIKLALPEYYQVPKYNPQYISSGYETDIRLVDSAAVYITFVGEGAGYRSTLGFYTYPLNAPRTQAPKPEEVTIMFPNISASGSGGSLEPGDKILLGNFPANTGIGFVLIADGWRNGAVTGGNWILYSNPDFNPEPTASLRQHNVILYDSVLQKMILSFEDIRRDNGGCDNDFNDAIFYISANPFKAIQNNNYTPIESANTQISSGNTGGLESNGKLASKVALRSFRRDIKSEEVKIERDKQQLFLQHLSALTVSDSQGSATKSLSSYFPVTGMTGLEVAYVSSPSELVNITNANDIFSLDYYLNNKRVAVGFVSHTSDHVYDHSKVICDRLNGSSITDIRTIELNGHKLINTTMLRANGETEYVIHFSIKKETVDYRLYSYWNIDTYPDGDYLNFQFWGSNMGAICSIAFDVLQSLGSEFPITSNGAETKIPVVFMKKGTYKNGKLSLTIANKTNATSLAFKSNISKAENFTTLPFSTVIPLSGAAEENLEIETGYLFDAGISLTTSGQAVGDHFYLADGSWGIDYKSQDANAINFSVDPCTSASAANTLRMERDPTLKGDIKGVVNLFRNTRGGNLSLSIANFNAISFGLQSDRTIELVLVPDSLSDWNNRPRVTIPATNGMKNMVVPFSQFKDNNGVPVKLDQIRNIVFSIKGNDANYLPFTLKVANTLFLNHTPETIVPEITEMIKVYPNPVVNQTIVQVPKDITNASLVVVDMYGRKQLQQDVVFANGLYVFKTAKLLNGLYKLVVIAPGKKSISTTINIVK